MIQFQENNQTDVRTEGWKDGRNDGRNDGQTCYRRGTKKVMGTPEIFPGKQS